MLSPSSLKKRSFSTRFLLFSIVGGLGVIVQLSILKICMGVLATGFVASQAVATFGAMTCNFLLNNRFTYSDASLKGTALFVGLLSFYAVCAFGAIANISVAAAIFSLSKIWWVAGLAGAAAGSLWNFSISSFVTWRPARTTMHGVEKSILTSRSAEILSLAESSNVPPRPSYSAYNSRSS
jgi:dolichol-phosphate mannosyltransferase